jgi:tetratricopeptide (TPR) repeat protein
VLVTLLRDSVNEERASSLETRLVNEDALIKRALESPLLGWGGYSRNLIKTESGRILSIIDGWWIITLGTQGLVGLTAMATTFMLPQILFYRRVPAKLWFEPAVAPATALVVFVGLNMIDNLGNAMPSPVYMVAIGGLMGMATVVIPTRRRDAARLLVEAEALKQAGQPEAAEMAYIWSIESYATAPETAGDPAILGEVAYAHEALADILAATPGRIAEAEELLIQAIKIHQAVVTNDPKSPDGLERLATDFEHLGRLLGTLGRNAESEQAWRQALELWEKLATRYSAASDFRRRWAESLNDLAWALVTRPEVDPDTGRNAAGLAGKAIELEPSVTGFWNTLGAANYQAGDLEVALAALQRSVELTEGGTGFDHYLLAMTYSRLGNLEMASESLARADHLSQTHAPDHPTLARLRGQAAALIHASEGMHNHGVVCPENETGA